VFLDGKKWNEVQGTRRFPLKPGKYMVSLEHTKRIVPPYSITITSGHTTKIQFRITDTPPPP
jgi:hypothetical protein